MGLFAVGLPTGARGSFELLARWSLNLITDLQQSLPEWAAGCPVVIVLHTSDYYAGVLGNKKLRFDLWGPQMDRFEKVAMQLTALGQQGIFVTQEARDSLGEKFFFQSSSVETVSGIMYKLQKEIQSI